MTVLDAYAILAHLRDEPAAEQVLPLFDRRDCVTTALRVAEVLDRMIRLFGVSEDDAASHLAQLPLREPVPVDAWLGGEAGRLRARHYHRVRRAVSMADCVAAAAARQVGERLATSDPHLLDLCVEQGNFHDRSAWIRWFGVGSKVSSRHA